MMAEIEEVEAPPIEQTSTRFPPNPLDGLIHLVKEVTNDGKGSRIILVKCGAVMPKFRTQDRLTGAFGWASVVTCPNCIPRGA